jgi:glucokinase
MQAMQVLAKYNIMGLGLGLGVAGIIFVQVYY